MPSISRCWEVDLITSQVTQSARKHFSKPGSTCSLCLPCLSWPPHQFLTTLPGTTLSFVPAQLRGQVVHYVSCGVAACFRWLVGICQVLRKVLGDKYWQLAQMSETSLTLHLWPIQNTYFIIMIMAEQRITDCGDSGPGAWCGTVNIPPPPPPGMDPHFTLLAPPTISSGVIPDTGISYIYM